MGKEGTGRGLDTAGKMGSDEKEWIQAMSDEAKPRTCGDCDVLTERDLAEGLCSPPVPPWSDAVEQWKLFSSKDAERCLCFKPRKDPP